MTTTDRPRFIGIGAHKAGTTWLYQNLRQHPGLWLPPLKELHVFDGLPNLHRVASRLSDAIEARRRGDPDADLQPIDFMRKFVEGKPKDALWYRSLFSEAGERISGEITPAYSTIDAESIKRVCDSFPKLRIVLIMRNPIERAWSHLRSDVHKPNLDPTTMTFDQLRARIDSPVSEVRTRYTSTLANWERFYRSDQFCIQFYDDIVVDPYTVLESICEFLGVECKRSYFAQTLAQRVHVSVEVPIRQDVQIYLARKYREEIAALQRRFGNHANRWLADCDVILDGV